MAVNVLVVKDIPIVVISTEGNNTRIARLQDEGARFIHKPFTPEIIRDTVKDFLLEDDADISGEAQRDAFKELLNVICGNVLPAIAGHQAEFNIGTSQILASKDAREQIGRDSPACVVYGMPREAVKLGAVDEIVPLPRIPQAILSVLERDGKPRQSSRKGD